MWEQVGWILLGILVAIGGTAPWYTAGRSKTREVIKLVREGLDVPEAVLDGTESDSEGGTKLTNGEKNAIKTEIGQAKAALDDLLGKK